MARRLPISLRLLAGIAVFVAVVLVGTTARPNPGGAAPSGSAPGAPGEKAIWTEADKDGFGTSTTESSKVWYTLDDGKLTEVYYPDLGTPSVRDLQFIVSDGQTFAELETGATSHQVQLPDDGRSLTYRQVNTNNSRGYTITKTYVTDPSRSTVLVNVTFVSEKPYQLYVLYDPSLNNGGDDDTATTQNGQLLASDGDVASALVGSPQFEQTSNGYKGNSDGWIDLQHDYKMDWSFGSASKPGNVVQTAKTTLTGLEGSRDLTLALGFGSKASAALKTAQASLASGFANAQTNYQTGWHNYLLSLEKARGKARPDSVSGSALLRTTYDVSAMMMRAHEDKTYHGASIASPSMPWVWGTGLDSRGTDDTSGAYHLVWARDLYQAATTMLAMGDEEGAKRALDFLFEKQQKPDGSFPQNSEVDGTQRWENTQLDEVSFPLILAYQLGRTDGTTYRDHVKKAADYIVANGPKTPQERWENAGGYSPATIAAEIAGLVSAAEIARVNGDQASADRYLRTADNWQRSVERWTVTTNGPLAQHPYYLRVTQDGKPNVGTTYTISDGGPCRIDQRAVVDTSYLELVRLGVKPPNDPNIVQSLAVVDAQLGYTTPNGTFWHRFNYDGYGEELDGDPWNLNNCDDYKNPDLRTVGRLWPIFAGERGEYLLAADMSGAAGHLQAIANTGNDGYMLPEQVWDDNPPSGQAGFPRGEGTFSATPLSWSHAQFIRLAWSIDKGHPVEQPEIVYDRYVGGTSQAGG
jgi:glucoamylase